MYTFKHAQMENRFFCFRLRR